MAADDPGVLFGEDQARYVLARAAKHEADALMAAAETAAVPARRLGTTGGDSLTLIGRQSIGGDEH